MVYYSKLLTSADPAYSPGGKNRHVEEDMEQYILAHDLGTSADKASLYTTEGKFVKTVTMGYETRSYNENWVEQNPEDWWKIFCAATKKLLEGIDNKNVLCVAFDGTFPNCLCVDKEGNALYPAIMWQDVRAVEEAKEIAALLPKEYLRDGFGINYLAYQTITRLMWLKKHEPEIFAKTYKVMSCSQGYLLMKLTGNAVDEVSTSVITGLMNLTHDDWSDEVLALAGIPRSMMPRLGQMTDIVGEVPEKFAEECGLAAGTKLVLGTGDTGCTSIGAGMLKPGDAYMNGGTSAGIMVKPAPGKPRAGGLTAASGSSLSWLKNTICVSEQQLAKESGKDVYDILNEEAAKAPIGSNGVLFHPYLSGERSPRNNPKAKGSFVGITLTTTRQDIIRSVLEGIGLNINVIFEEVKKSYDIKRMLIVGGLGKGDVARQIFADIMDVELVALVHSDECATVGCAVLGGIALGIYKDTTAVEKFMEIKSVTYPNKENHEKYKKIMPLFEKVYEGLAPVFEEM